MNFISIIQEDKVLSAAAKVAQERGIKAYLIGGYVRDLILKRNSKDKDIVCEGPGIDFAKQVAKTLSDKIKVNYFENFGTAQFIYSGMDYEFVGARKESYSRDSRNPIVEAGSIEDDQNRRDFTINALAISLNESDLGEVIDPFNGLEDLEKKIIRTPLDPDITFSDDPLRMLRAIRFSAQLNFEIDLVTLASIHKNAHRIDIITQERIHTEINKIILSEIPSIGFKLLFNAGILKLIFPEMVALHGVEDIGGKSHKDNFYHTLQVLDNLARVSDKLWLRWAAILHDIAKPQTKKWDEQIGWTFHNHEVIGSKMVPRIFKRMKLPLDHQMDYVRKLVYLHLRPIALVKDNISDAAIRRLLYEAGEDIEDLMMLCEADITSKNEVKVKRYLQNFQTVREKMIEIEAKDHVRNFQPPITGEIIMQRFNLSPCREIGIIKSEIKEAILDGIIQNNYDEAFALMLKIGERLNLVSVK